MTEKLYQAQYNITKKSKWREFYESNKILIISSILILIIFFGALTIYLENKKNKRILLSEDYIQAKLYIERGNENEAKNILKGLVLANDPTYSTLSLFLILNQNLFADQKELSALFEHVLANNKFEKEVKNLLIYKKALFDSNFVNESELLESLKSLINTESFWKPHALLILGDYFVAKGEYLKAKEFYIQIFTIKNLQKDLYNQTKSRLKIITNDQ